MTEDLSNQEQSKNWWGSTLSKLKTALSKTKEAVVDSVVEHPVHAAEPANYSEAALEQKASPVQAPPAPPRQIDDDYLEELEEKLIKADLGLVTVETMIGHLRTQAKQSGWTSHDVEKFLHKEFQLLLQSAPASKLTIKDGQLNIILVVGVNGTGKTTSIGKLSWRFKSQGHKVLIAAGDTFRAAAESQLEIWSQRAGVDIVRLADGSDPGAVVFKAIQRAKEENYDILIVDTAGRLHNKANLMAELKKIRGVVDKNAPDCNIESLLVIDASTGQNGMQQARVFTEICPLTGVILTKLDGTSKGGIIFSIARELKIPVKLIGLGEQIDDLRDFEPELFVEALFS
ncbi:MAG: signal recognition particle-docking protein FtsY [Candidatus Obscuribacterales bacterium]|nr:signal recognition particle-docking protein FtsY [Candidatus Obscuribacterales bacterium]